MTIVPLLRGAVLVLAVGVFASCGGETSDNDRDDDDPRGGTSGSSGEGGAGGSGRAGTSGSSGSGAGGGGSGGGSAGNAGTPASGGSAGSQAGTGVTGGASGSAGTEAGSAGTTAEPLPNGSRQVGHIVNLVNADAVAEVEAFLRGEGAEGQPAAATEFYEYYLDEYDFLVIIVDHQVENATAAAAFDAVYRPANLATGDGSTDLRLAHGSERLKGVIGTYYSEGGQPPLEHELAHFWAAHLDPMFGFGRDAEEDYGSHWGLTSVNGALGGFDEASMECATPAGARPPDCTPESNGRYRYVFDLFYPYVNRAVDYAPLELYLMGFIPPTEVPESTLLLEDCSYYDYEFDDTTLRLTLEASGTSEILFSDILDFHGTRALATAEEKALTAAFIVVSAAPASDAVMATASSWQETFGNYAPELGLLRSFEVTTGGRATLATRLGRRRTPDDPVPMPPAPVGCSLTDQDCGPGFGCYGSVERECDPAGTVPEDGTCEYAPDCIPGYTCPNSLKVCRPYCEPLDETDPKACQTFCENAYNHLVDDMDNVVGGYCSP